MRRVVAAPDKFRGTATAAQVAAAIGEGAARAGWSVEAIPVADGGEGTLDVLGGPNRTATVTGPLGAPVEARWRLAGTTAIVEMAEASGLVLAGGADGNDPIAADTRGTGELLQLAVESGARRLIVGLGGSATVDGGLGALSAMHPHQRYRAIDIDVACDVRTPFLDAADVFGPQKGASRAQVRLLRNRLARLADVYEADHGVDVRTLPGAGAAGGLAGGLAALGATLHDGFSLIAEEIGLYDAVEGADLVITGEGFLDHESFEGKVVGGIVELAASFDVPVVAIVGRVLDGMDDRVEAVSLVDRYGEDRAHAETAWCVADATAAVLSERG